MTNATDFEKWLTQEIKKDGKKKAQAAKAPKALPSRPSLPPPSPWQSSALILLTVDTLCRCGQHYRAPNRLLMLEKHHIRSGARILEALDGPTAIALAKTLPARIEVRQETVDICQVCLPLFTSKVTTGDGEDEMGLIAPLLQ